MQEKFQILRFEIVVLNYGTLETDWWAWGIWPVPTATLLQNILKHIPDYMTSKPRPHYESSQLWAPQILYQKILRTETLMEMLAWEN